MMKFAIEPLPPQSIVDGHVMNKAAVQDTLYKMFKESRITQKDVALSISGHSVIIKKLNLPAMKRDVLEEQIQWEAEQHIPFDIAEVEVDYNIISKNPDTGQLDVLLVAVRKEEIQDLVEVVRLAKLIPLVVDIDAFALQNAFELNYGFNSDEIIALLNVGAAVTTINILNGGVSQFTRDITNGGASITEEIQKQLHVSFEEAEAYKAGGGLNSSEVVPQEVDGIISNVVDSLASEIQRSLDFYMATTSKGEVSQIYVTGGTSHISYLRSAVERRSRIPTVPIDPFRRVLFDDRKFNRDLLRVLAPQATVALGLALRKQKERI